MPRFASFTPIPHPSTRYQPSPFTALLPTVALDWDINMQYSICISPLHIGGVKDGSDFA